MVVTPFQFKFRIRYCTANVWNIPSLHISTITVTTLFRAFSKEQASRDKTNNHAPEQD